MKRYGWLAIALFICVLAFLISNFLEHVKIAKTRDVLAVVCVSFGHSDPGLVVTSERLVEKAKKEFPWIKVANGSILDEWGRPIVIQISGRKIEVRSSGVDGIMNTSDDLTRTAELGGAQ